MVCRLVGLSVTIMSPAKTDELIEMPFGLWTRVGFRNHVLDRGPDPPWAGTILRGKGVPHCKVQGLPSMCGGSVAFLSNY